jgi:hypothetical protein
MGKASRRKHSGSLQVDTDSRRRKLSECLVDVIEPYRSDDFDREAYSNLVTLAATAWNLSVFPKEERESAILRALQAVPLLRRRETYILVQRLLERKEQLFPNDRRFIAPSDVVEERDEFRIVVASLSNHE